MKKDWQIISGDTPTICRFSGKIFPQMTYSRTDNKIKSRDDNGKNPSITLETNDISIKGINQLLSRISTPHPSKKILEEFLQKIEVYNKPTIISPEIKRMMEDLCSKTIESWNDHAMPFTECDRLAGKEVEEFMKNNNIVVKE